MGDHNPHPSGVSELNHAGRRADLEVKKLCLEIEQLQAGNSTYEKALKLIPFVTALVAILGLWFAVVRFFSEQKIDRKLQIERRVSDNIEELLTFPTDDSLSGSRLLFLLKELDSLSKYVPERRPPITVIIAELVAQDCDFNRRRDVLFNINVLRHWPDYRDYLKSNPERLTFISYKYFQALRQLHEKEPVYFETLDFQRDSGYIVGDEGYTEEATFLLFESLVRGFAIHLSMVEQGSKRWLKSIQQFDEALQNPRLTQRLFGTIIVESGPIIKEPTRSTDDSTPKADGGGS